MFVSALASVCGAQNPLGLPKVERATVLLVDGLGSANIRAAAGHAPFLNAVLKTDGSISCGFPATTATSLTSFATGLSAGEHGIVGYQVFDRAKQRQANLLSGWGPDQVPEEWQPNQTVTERAVASGIGAYVIGPDEYRDSGFTRATMRGANYVGARTIAQRFEQIRRLHATKAGFLTYCYIPELDQAAHAKGVSSSSWLNLVEEVDSELRRLAVELDTGDGLIVTADHGVIDVLAERQLVLEELVDWPEQTILSGDPRVAFIYTTGDSEKFKSELTLALGNSCLVLSREEVVSAGWYGPVVRQRVMESLPELFIIALQNVALYHRGFSKPASFRMVGQHGALNMDELQVPLLRFGGYQARVGVTKS